MSIVKKGFRDRLSNVLAWGGSLGGVFLIVMLVLIADRSVDGYKYHKESMQDTTPADLLYQEMILEGKLKPSWGPRRGDIRAAIMGLAVYLGCALMNYLIVGSPRLLPWRDIED